MARYKGFLNTAVPGAKAIDSLKDGDKILISEGCTHHRQCGDIGTVKAGNDGLNHKSLSILECCSASLSIILESCSLLKGV